MTGVFPKTLIREVAERRAIIFVGSGVSKTAKPILPTWAGLLKSMSEDLPKKVDRTLVRKLISQNHFLDAAQIVCDELPRPDFQQKIRDSFQFEITQHHQIYEHLIRLDPKIFVTTNYDELLEKGLENYSSAEAIQSCTQTEKNALNYVRSPMRTVFKLHGCVTDVPNVVLSRTSYFNAKRDNPGFHAVMSALMTVNTVIFFGYGLSDPDIQLILENINLLNTSDHPHYVVSQKSESIALKSAYESTYNLKIIEYPKGEHDKMMSLLVSLADSVVSYRENRGII